MQRAHTTAAEAQNAPDGPAQPRMVPRGGGTPRGGDFLRARNSDEELRLKKVDEPKGCHANKKPFEGPVSALEQ